MSWRGAQLNRSADGGSSYSAMLSTTAGATIGRAVGVLGDFAGGNIFDHINSLSVVMQSGQPLLSYAKTQVYNGAGAYFLGAAGRWEVIHAMSATLTAPNTYTLSNFLRGVKGTQWAMGLHAVGDELILIDGATLQRPNPGSAQIGLERLYKGVTFRAALASATAQAFTNNAVALKPYSPVRLRGTRDGSNNLTISCLRRTRIGGEWRDFVDVPIGEASLQIDFEIWNSTYTTRLRLFPGVASTSTPYSAAEQTADGITPGDPVYVRVYQISAAVGRGYKLEGTV